MTRRQMMSAVLQTVFLITCSLVVHEKLWASAGDKVTSNGLYQNYTEALKAAENATSPSNQTFTIGAGAVNTTSPNTTGDDDASSVGPMTSKLETMEMGFWLTLPRNVLVYTIITIMAYYWQIGLERAFPARPRLSDAKVLSNTGQFREDESREEEVVKKWISRGKVHRASLSWWNTWIKWVLDVVVGGLWMNSVYCLLDGLLKMGPTAEILNVFKWRVIFAWGTSLIGSRPLASLIALIIVPANKRIVFVAGIDLAFWTFIGLFVNLAIPWLAATEFAQQVIGGMTEAAWNVTATAQPRFTDEL